MSSCNNFCQANAGLLAAERTQNNTNLMANLGRIMHQLPGREGLTRERDSMAVRADNNRRTRRLQEVIEEVLDIVGDIDFEEGSSGEDDQDDAP